MICKSCCAVMSAPHGSPHVNVPQIVGSIGGISSAMGVFGLSVLVVVNLVGGFQALGTLLAVGLMILPAASARLWTRELGPLIGVRRHVVSFAGVWADVRETWDRAGLLAEASGPAALQAAMRSEHAQWAALVKTSGFTPES